MTALAFTKVNDRSRDAIRWSSSAPNVARVDADGILTAVAPGKATLTAQAGVGAGDEDRRGAAGDADGRSRSRRPSRARAGRRHPLHASRPRTRRAETIAGLTPTWFVSPGNGQIDADGAFVGYEPGDYLVTANLGGKQASTVVHLEARDVRRSVTVVGRLPRTEFPTSEVWIHPNGKVAYLGTHGGGDRVYAIDITNPANPTIVDSIVVEHAPRERHADDGRRQLHGVHARGRGRSQERHRHRRHARPAAPEADRRSSPTASPAACTRSTSTRIRSTASSCSSRTTAPARSTSIDINDPAHPKRVTEFKTNRPDPARYVHDLDIHDGLLYASYWNDGLVILDIGNGKWGGRPDKPVIVSQFKYDLDSLYREVEAVSGAGLHARHAHGVASARRPLRLHRRRGLSQRRRSRARRTRRRAACTARCR